MRSIDGGPRCHRCSPGLFRHLKRGCERRRRGPAILVGGSGSSHQRSVLIGRRSVSHGGGRCGRAVQTPTAGNVLTERSQGGLGDAAVASDACPEGPCEVRHRGRVRCSGQLRGEARRHSPGSSGESGKGGGGQRGRAKRTEVLPEERLVVLPVLLAPLLQLLPQRHLGEVFLHHAPVLQLLQELLVGSDVGERSTTRQGGCCSHERGLVVQPKAERGLVLVESRDAATAEEGMLATGQAQPKSKPEGGGGARGVRLRELLRQEGATEDHGLGKGLIGLGKAGQAVQTTTAGSSSSNTGRCGRDTEPGLGSGRGCRGQSVVLVQLVLVLLTKACRCVDGGEFGRDGLGCGGGAWHGCRGCCRRRRFLGISVGGGHSSVFLLPQNRSRS
mmetsp:Transcript_16604/g.46440  ORF Transcript_16604/g.46440 Transcript_16604/m.46440 type:complete len:388 (+) Transcript_16604:3131-4294(+)